MINLKLAEKQKLSKKDIYNIGKAHGYIDWLKADMNNCKPNHKKYKDVLKLWTEMQFALQTHWKFDRDSTYHPTWTLPHCTCPKMDNADAGRHRYFHVKCPVHKNEVKNEIR